MINTFSPCQLCDLSYIITCHDLFESLSTKFIITRVYGRSFISCLLPFRKPFNCIIANRWIIEHFISSPGLMSSTSHVAWSCARPASFVTCPSIGPASNRSPLNVEGVRRAQPACFYCDCSGTKLFVFGMDTETNAKGKLLVVYKRQFPVDFHSPVVRCTLDC